MASSKRQFLNTTDFSVSKESFELIYDPHFDLLKTNPQPGPEEIGSYYLSAQYISHTDAAISFSDKLYQWVKKFTLSKKLRLLNSFNTSEKTLLDIGCGTGDFLMKCAANNWKVKGIEPSEKARNIASKKLDNRSESIVLNKLQELGDEKFHVITLWHVLEHVHDPDNYIKTIKRHLHPEGVLVVAVPNFKSFDAAYYKEYWAGYDVPRHLWHFSKHAVQQIFAQQKIQLVQTRPMWFDAFYVSLLSEGYKKNNFKLLRAFFVGCWSNLRGITTQDYSSHIYILKMTKMGV